MGEQTPTNASDNTDYPIPKDRYGDPITYDGNPACLAGVMHDINKWIERTGNYKLLFEQYAVPLSNGALAIDQPDNIMRSCTQTAPTHRQGQSFSQRLGRYLPRPLHRLSRLLGSVGPRNRSQSSLVQRRGR